MSSIELTASFDKDHDMRTFINMLAWMELCGNIGHCTDFNVRLDGDGTGRPKFRFKNPEQQKAFDDLRHSYLKDYEIDDDISQFIIGR